MSIPANMGAKTMETEIESRFPEARDRRRIKRLVIGCAETVRWKEDALVVDSTMGWLQLTIIYCLFQNN